MQLEPRQELDKEQMFSVFLTKCLTSLSDWWKPPTSHQFDNMSDDIEVFLPSSWAGFIAMFWEWSLKLDFRPDNHSLSAVR